MSATLETAPPVPGLTVQQSVWYAAEWTAARRDPTTALLWCLFLGGIGAHRFYLKQTGLGILYLATCWTLIPACVAFVELFLIRGRVARYNAARAAELAIRARTA